MTLWWAGNPTCCSAVPVWDRGCACVVGEPISVLPWGMHTDLPGHLNEGGERW